MGLFVLIVGGVLAAWGVLQVFGLLAMLLMVSRQWTPLQERTILLVLALFMPFLFTIDPIDHLAWHFGIAPQRSGISFWLLWGLGGIFIALGLLLNALIR